MRVQRLAFPILLSLVYWLQVLVAVQATSMVIDEGLHLASGYTILRTGDYRMIEEHPPFVKIWAALPLLFIPDIPSPRDIPEWEEALYDPSESLPLIQTAQKLITSYQPIDRLVFPSRVMVSLMGLLLGAVTYRWAADLSGKARSAGLALFLLMLDPNILAHSSLVGTDLGAAATVVMTLFLFTRWMRRPTALRSLASGVALGIALGTKLSAALLLPTLFLLGILSHPRRFQAWVGILGAAALTVWALYGFEVGYIPGTNIPAPAASHAITILRLRRHINDGHPAFLLGECRLRGWWYYFPVAFALKTPLPTMVLILLAGFSLLLRNWRQLINASLLMQRWGPIFLFPAFYGIFALVSPLNIGYRHLLPILPFLFILAGLYDARFLKLRFLHAQQVLSLALLIWLASGTLRIAPHYLAYFNELAGGPDNGWRYLADSNTDWSQGYKALASFQRKHKLGRIHLSAFPLTYDPAIYGVVYEPLTPMGGNTPAVFPSRFNPPPGDYVISATTLDGIPLVDPEMYDWFRKREPDARIAHVLFYYHIPPQDPPPTWVAQCTVPDVPLSPEAVAEGFGRDDLRLVYFDCSQGWLYPAGGDMPGWYVFYRDLVTETPFTRSHLSSARLSYEQKRQSGTPPFRVYEWPHGAHVPGPSAHLLLPEGTSSPVPLDGPLVFLGAKASRQADALEVETWWRVTAGPITRPLSIMAHLLTGAGDVVGLADGLGVSPVMWQPGDVIVQRHHFPLPPSGEDVYLRTGAYWLDTMERWPLANAPEMNIMLILLPIHSNSER